MTILPANWDQLTGGPLVIVQGATNGDTWLLTDGLGAIYNLVGKSAKLQFRTRKGVATPFLELSTSNGGIRLDTVLGTLTWDIPAIAPVYDNGHTYAVGNVITYSGLSYRCIQTSLGVLPTDTLYWIPTLLSGDISVDSAVWDLELISVDGVDRLVEGTMVLSRRVTA